MRDFYRTYENYPAMLSLAIQLGWIQNVVIMEAELTMELREWYMKAAKQFVWSKTELIANIDANAHEDVVLSCEEEHSDVNQESELDEPKKNTLIFPRKTIIIVVLCMRLSGLMTDMQHIRYEPP